jgi:hypothetical protein
MSMYRALLLLLISMQALPGLAENHALLIGISDYADPRIPDLEGPYHDVIALRQLLIGHWGFTPERVTTLLNRQATERAVLAALDSLKQNSLPGDDILIYFSGHGTSASDPELGARLHLPDGSGAIVASDFDPDRVDLETTAQPVDDGMLVGRYELRPRLRALDDERNVLVMFDACFSGNAARNTLSAYIPRNKRQLPLISTIPGMMKPRTPRHGSSEPCEECNTEPNDAFSYDNVVYFGAAAENQLAVDFSQAEIDAGLVTSYDGKPHGGFTDSLLRVLSDTSSARKTLSYGRLFNLLVNQFNISCQVCGHNPVSLPYINNDNNHLLDRLFLAMPSANVRGGRRPAADSDSILRIAAEHNAGAATQLANLRANQPDSQLASQPSVANDANFSPDIVFERQSNQLLASAADGRLINTFPATVSSSDLKAWLVSRQWLKRRQANDLQQESGRLRAEFRHPIYGTTVQDGDAVFFNLQADENVGLSLLSMNAKGELSVLYPTSAEEASRVFTAGSSFRIPATDATPILVTPPWGTDVVLFYSLPPAHPILAELALMSNETNISLDNLHLAVFETLLDSGHVSYSSASIRFNSEARD